MVKIEDMVSLDIADFMPENKELWLISTTARSKGEIKRNLIIGDCIPKDKRIHQISSGYTYYFRTAAGLKTYSAFSYDIECLLKDLNDEMEYTERMVELGITYDEFIGLKELFEKEKRDI